jgi:hypothetical protein
MPLHDPRQAFADDFNRSGFGVIRNALKPDSVEDLLIRLGQLIARQDSQEPVPLQRTVPRIVEQDACFAELATSRPLIETLTNIFGIVPQLISSYGHEKPEHTRSHTGAHSDVAHLPGVPHYASLLIVKAMYALTAVNVGSGGTVVFPGSHKLPADEQAKVSRGGGHYVSLDPGDLLLFHANTVHTATENSSDASRLSIWFMFALPWMRVFPGYEYGDDFLNALRPRLASEPQLGAIFGLDDPYST